MVFPGSHWKFQRAAGQGLWTCARLTACLGAQLSSPQAVPGNSSISLLPPRWQENETQAPPLRPTNPESGCWELGFRTPASSHTTLPPGYCELLSQPSSQAAIDDGVFLWDISSTPPRSLPLPPHFCASTVCLSTPGKGKGEEGHAGGGIIKEQELARGLPASAIPGD